MTVVKSRVVVQVSRTNWRESKQGGVVLSDTGGEIFTQPDGTDPSYNNIKGDAGDAGTEEIVENDVITDPDAVKKSKFRCNLAIYQWIIILQSGC